MVPPIKDCVVCQGQEKLWSKTKNRKNINIFTKKRYTGLHKEKVHGIPYQPQHQPQQHQQPSKKPKKSKPSSDEESDDGLIDGFFF